MCHEARLTTITFLYTRERRFRSSTVRSSLSTAAETFSVNSTISSYHWDCSASFAMHTFSSWAEGVTAIVFDWWFDLFMWVSDCKIGGFMWLDRWVFDLFTCRCVYFKFLGLSFFMWIWWFFRVYVFDLLEVLVEDRDFVCILSIGLLNVSYFSVWLERKSWFSRENVDDCFSVWWNFLRKMLNA